MFSANLESLSLAGKRGGGGRDAADSAGSYLEVADGADKEADTEGKNILPPELLAPTPLLCFVNLLLKRRCEKSGMRMFFHQHLHLSDLVLC